MSGWWAMIALVAAIALPACANHGQQGPAWELAGHPGLLYQVKSYYERHAREEGGRCVKPILAGVARSEVLAEDEDRLVVGLRYAYRDYNRDGDDCDDEFRPLRCNVARECRGYAERTFTIAKGETGLEVIDMTGERRRRD